MKDPAPNDVVVIVAVFGTAVPFRAVAVVPRAGTATVMDGLRPAQREEFASPDGAASATPRRSRAEPASE